MDSREMSQQFPQCAFVVIGFEEGDNDYIMKIIWHYLFSHLLVKMLWNVFIVKSNSLDALTMLVCLIAFLGLYKEGGRLRSSIIAFCRAKSRGVGSTVEGLLSRL